MLTNPVIEVVKHYMIIAPSCPRSKRALSSCFLKCQHDIKAKEMICALFVPVWVDCPKLNPVRFAYLDNISFPLVGHGAQDFEVKSKADSKTFCSSSDRIIIWHTIVLQYRTSTFLLRGKISMCLRQNIHCVAYNIACIFTSKGQSTMDDIKLLGYRYLAIISADTDKYR